MNFKKIMCMMAVAINFVYAVDFEEKSDYTELRSGRKILKLTSDYSKNTKYNNERIISVGENYSVNPNRTNSIIQFFQREEVLNITMSTFVSAVALPLSYYLIEFGLEQFNNALDVSFKDREGVCFKKPYRGSGQSGSLNYRSYKCIMTDCFGNDCEKRYLGEISTFVGNLALIAGGISVFMALDEILNVTPTHTRNRSNYYTYCLKKLISLAWIASSIATMYQTNSYSYEHPVLVDYDGLEMPDFSDLVGRFSFLLDAQKTQKNYTISAPHSSAKCFWINALCATHIASGLSQLFRNKPLLTPVLKELKIPGWLDLETVIFEAHTFDHYFKMFFSQNKKNWTLTTAILILEQAKETIIFTLIKKLINHYSAVSKKV
jgi:hypothetical protein